jgi:hypothetical protein
MKIVVFDLDETLGYFTQFGIFIDTIKFFIRKNNLEELTQKDFNNILNLYPEYIRPNIINILNYLKQQKIKNCCHKIMIYTNNNGPREWCRSIIEFFDEKINYKLIDQVIAAFKIHGKHIELCRTTHDKTHNDLIRCTKIPANSEICFIDDSYHPDMANDNIYYINLKPYYYDLPFEELIHRFTNNNIYDKILKDVPIEVFEDFMNKRIRVYNYDYVEKDDDEYEVDKILGKKILVHLQDFFNKTKNNTTRKYTRKSSNKISNKRNKTQRNR